ncbi:sideroflexin-4 [Gouania willdenowi]|uniref:Sideroflexin 4 n=1 Tax=Gouania willdenowi TaxID=441366 RepID=A0A8C5I7M3_GOUWI|nr:sideroflexin-4 [Gouania willdenowi]
MDPNLLHWKSQEESFFRRLKIWLDLLDPTLLLSSDAEIQKANTLLRSGEKLSEEDTSALSLSLSSVHAGSGEVLPLPFRPPAVFPVSGTLVVASFLPHRTVKPALFWQFLVQSYMAGFNHINRNRSLEKEGPRTTLNHQLLMAGTVSVSTCAGALPQIFINRLRVTSPPIKTFCRFLLPIPLSAGLAFFNLLTIRHEEMDTGIQVFDDNGKPVGVSKAAGEQAVKNTALSRAVLFGTTAAVPNLMFLLLNSWRPFQRNLTSYRHITVAFVLGLMIPVSFSLFPQVGTIQRENVEAELQGGALGEKLLYHRGL